MKIGYGKLGRTMSLTLAGCGAVGGDHEPLAVLLQLAQQRPSDQFFILGRNTGEFPYEAKLPKNIINPWREYQWSERLRAQIAARITARRSLGNKGALDINEQTTLRHIFRELTEEMFTDMDAHIWWVGQHGTSNTPIPRIEDRTSCTKPQDWCAYYASYVMQGINAWRDQDPWRYEEVYLNADPRNRHKMRDLKWPLRHPVLTQYNFTNRIKHERYGDPFGVDRWMSGGYTQFTNAPDTVWESTVKNVYSRIEMNSLVPGTPSGDIVRFNASWDRPGKFGLFINEARSIGVPLERTRLYIMHHWVMPLQPAFVHGTWSKNSSNELNERWGIDVEPVKPEHWDRDYYRLLHSVRCTFTTPTSGSGWATTKPWEAFAAGTVCFFHPAYDDQDNILGDAPVELRDWLRVTTPEQLKTRVEYLSSLTGKAAFEWIIDQQYKHFIKAIAERPYMKMIEERIS